MEFRHEYKFLISSTQAKLIQARMHAIMQLDRNAVSNGSYEIRSIDFDRSEEHTSELKSQSELSYAVFCLKKQIGQ